MGWSNVRSHENIIISLLRGNLMFFVCVATVGPWNCMFCGFFFQKLTNHVFRVETSIRRFKLKGSRAISLGGRRTRDCFATCTHSRIFLRSTQTAPDI